MAKLAMALVTNDHVKSLYLHNTGINDKGAELLAFVLRFNKTLEHLSLNQNRIGSEGCAALASALNENRTLVSLGLSNNAITNHGAKKLVKMLKRNYQETSISRIFIDGNHEINEKLADKIDRYCLKARARNCRSRCFAPYARHTTADTAPCSDIVSLAPSLGQRTVESSQSEYDMFFDLASYIERVHEKINKEGSEASMLSTVNEEDI